MRGSKWFSEFKYHLFQTSKLETKTYDTYEACLGEGREKSNEGNIFPVKSA